MYMVVIGMSKPLPRDLDIRARNAQAKSISAIREHERLQDELVAIQEELERRVTLAKTSRRRRSLPWKDNSS